MGPRVKMRTFLVVGLVIASSSASAVPGPYRRGQVSGVAAAFRSQRLNAALGFGGVGLGLGVAGGVLASKAVTDSEKSTAAVALGAGAGLAVGAVLLAVLRNPYERRAEEFLRLSANEDEDRVERRFQTLVAEERRERRLVGIVNLLASGAVIAVGLLSTSSTREVLVGLGAGSAAASIFALVAPPPLPFESLETAGATVGLAPLPSGGAVLASAWRF